MSAFTAYIYNKVLKPFLFARDPEKVHGTFLRLGEILGKYSFTRGISSLFFNYSDKSLNQNIMGINFTNPIGLAPGFDKDARLTGILPSVGFGFAVVGSITGQPCRGNDKPRLWRLVKSRSLVVYYGLKNDGSETIARRLQNKSLQIPIGISIAKTNSAQTAEPSAGMADYLKAYRDMSGIGDFYVINISCPNAFGGEPFTSPELLDKLLSELDKIRVAAPTLLKLSPDLSREQIDSILEIAGRHMVEGFICSNLTKNRTGSKILDDNVPPKGGISGKALEDKANELIKYVYQKTRGHYVIIGCGGVFSAEDAYKKIKLGASLVELITGMIFEGPQLIGDINRGLVRLLNKDGFKNISQAIGVDNRIK